MTPDENPWSRRSSEQEGANELRSRTIENQARTIGMLLRDGHFTRQSVEAVVGNDLSKLVYVEHNLPKGVKIA